MDKKARANVTPVRQRSQFSCMAASMAMALNALGYETTEDEVNKVMGAKPMEGASWEQALATAQHYGCRGTLVVPATLNQIKAWTDAGNPVMIAWNPEGRDWSHASVVFDVVEGDGGSYMVHVADPNIPNPNQTVRVVSEEDFYKKWSEKWPYYLVRRPALCIEREITPEGRQIMAKEKVIIKKEDLPKHRTGPIDYPLSGTHMNRSKDVAKGRSRKEKHKKKWVEKEAVQRIATKYLQREDR